MDGASENVLMEVSLLTFDLRFQALPFALQSFSRTQGGVYSHGVHVCVVGRLCLPQGCLGML